MDPEIKITYLPWQREFFFGSPEVRFKVLAKGRRLGATQGAAFALIQWAIEGKYKHALWIDTIFSNIQKYVDRYFWPTLKQLPRSLWTYHRQDKMLSIMGNTIDFRSSDQPEKIEGFKFDICMINEAGIVLKTPYIWDNAIQPSLLDNPQSKAFIFGSPKGKKVAGGLPHRFHDLYVAASKLKDWKAYHYTTFDNPVIDKNEVRRMMDESSEAVAQQEFMGRFLATDSTILIDQELIDRAVACNVNQSSYRSAPRVMGIDPGFANDSTVVVRRQGLKVFEPDEILPSRDDTVTAARIARLIESWKPDSVACDFGLGTGVVSILNQMGCQVTGVWFGGKALDAEKYHNRRAEIYDRVRIRLSEGLDLPNHAKLLVDLGSVGVGHDSRGRLQLEKKDKIKEKLGRSPDFGDALALTEALPVMITTQLQPDQMTFEEKEIAFITGTLYENYDIQDVMVN